MVDGPGYAARSDVGRTRTDNEDRFLAKPPLFAVADGMGGHQAGEVASGLAIELLDAIAGRTPPPSEDEIVDTIERSNVAIRDGARSRADLAGMGTTCTVVVIDEAIHVAHVGDSRAYRFSDGRLVQLTDDHSLVASMVRDGVLSSAEALVDGRRNIITRALGADDEVRVDVVGAERRPGDRILVCTDGLHGQVDEAAIAGVLAEETDLRVAADRLIGLANAAGGDDNVTVIVIDPDALAGSGGDQARDARGETEGDAGVTEKGSSASSRRPGRRTAVFLVLLAIILIVLAIVAWLWAAPAVAG
ncbi:MAG: Stp1/IreP family PP2C-type Ser/Thr phosphatase [Chloroflexota bacterium]